MLQILRRNIGDVGGWQQAKCRTRNLPTPHSVQPDMAAYSCESHTSRYESTQHKALNTAACPAFPRTCSSFENGEVRYLTQIQRQHMDCEKGTPPIFTKYTMLNPKQLSGAQLHTVLTLFQSHAVLHEPGERVETARQHVPIEHNQAARLYFC